MKVLYNVSIPAAVCVDDRVFTGSLKKDVLVDAEVLVVFPLKPTQTLGRLSAAARVQDSYTGEILTIQAFNEQAKSLSKLTVGDIVNAYGQMGQFRGRRYFSVTEFKNEIAFYNNVQSARQALGEAAATEREDADLGPRQIQEMPEFEEVAALG